MRNPSINASPAGEGGGGGGAATAKRAGLLRCGKSCRLRWMNYLRPCVKRGQIAPDEEDLILRLHRLLGNRWSLIAGRIPGRTDNEIKNYWNTHLSKKLISQGIDPRTHKPLNPDHQYHDKQQQHHKASSSKANRKSSTSPKHNNNNNNNPTSSSGLEEKETTTNSGGSTHQLISSNEENIYLIYEIASLDQHHHPIHVNNGYTSLLNCGGGGDGNNCGMDLRSNIQGISNEEDEDINYCTDDGFSSFLNSLINEEAFTTQQQQQQLQLQQQQHQAINGIVPNSDPLVSITTSTLGLGTGWESSLISSTSNQSDPSKRVNDHLE